MEVEKIFFDMDGVLADFDRGVIEICGLEPIPQNKKPYVDSDYAELWKGVREAGHFYDSLNLVPGAKELFDAVYEKYGDKCELLTGIPKPKRGVETAREDKVKWTRRVLSKDVKINLVYREEKPNYCKGKNCILIDDLETNINEWIAMGGTGILFTDAESTIERLKDLGII